MTNQIKKVDNPIQIADEIFRIAINERYEIIEENEKRAKQFKEPLSVPAWNLTKMLENIDKLTEMNFANPHFQQYAIEHPWNGESSCKAWKKVATNTLRDSYLFREAKSDPDLFKQMCKKWPELTPDPNLTDEQRAELSNLQKQADDIIERAKGLVDEFSKLVEQEKDIIRSTQAKYDTRIADQTRYVRVNLPYYKEHVNKW